MGVMDRRSVSKGTESCPFVMIVSRETDCIRRALHKATPKPSLRPHPSSFVLFLSFFGLHDLFRGLSFLSNITRTLQLMSVVSQCARPFVQPASSTVFLLLDSAKRRSLLRSSLFSLLLFRRILKPSFG